MAQSGPLSHFALRRIAAAHRPTTIVAAKAALREAGLPLKLAHDLLQRNAGGIPSAPHTCRLSIQGAPQKTRAVQARGLIWCCAFLSGGNPQTPTRALVF